MTHAPTQRARPDARHVDQWRTLRGEAGRALLETAEQTLSSIEGPVRRRPDQRESRRQLVEALLANLAEAALVPTPRPVIVPERLRKQVPARYRHPAFGKAVGPTTELLASAGLATMDKGTRKGRKATTLQPGPELLRLIADLGPSSANLGRAARRGDPIVLSVTTRGPKGRSCTWVDYRDTPETRAMRAEMDRINDHLKTAPIALAEGASPVDLDDRWLSRRFKLLPEQPERFDQSGRLFGGFWQPMAKVDRGGLLIAGEPCVTLDYSTAFTRIALARVGQASAARDLYEIPGMEALTRSQKKAAINCLYFTRAGMTQWPKDLADLGLSPETLPPGCTPKKVRAAVLAHLPSLAPYLNEGLATDGPLAGYELMHLESTIMTKVLLQTVGLGWWALPIHDALLAPASRALEAKALMEATAEEVIGRPIQVSFDPHP